MKLRSQLYRAARDLGDVQAVATGNPAKIGKRMLRKRLYKANGRTMRKLLRGLGL